MMICVTSWFVSCRDEMSLNDVYGCFDFFMSNKRQIFPPQNNDNRLKIWPFLTKLWLFQFRCPSKCTSEKMSFKVRQHNIKNYRENKENEPLQECFPTCGCQICTETFLKDIKLLLSWLRKLSVKNRYFLNIVQFKWNLVFWLSFWPWRRICKKFFRKFEYLASNFS